MGNFQCVNQESNGSWSNTFLINESLDSGGDEVILSVPRSASTLVVMNNGVQWSSSDTDDNSRNISISVNGQTNTIILKPGHTIELPVFAFGAPRYPTTITLVSEAATSGSSYFTLRSADGN